jgi:MFS family permease
MVDVGSVGGATSPLSLLRWVALSLFAHIVAVVILMQLYPRSLLNEFGGDDGHASRYLAGLSTATSVIEFAMVPRLSELSDEWGRKPLLRALLALQALICVVLSMSPENVWFITAAYLASSLPTAVFAISSAVIADVTRGGDVGTSVQSFGFVLGTFGLAMAVGPLAGGSLVSVSPRLAAIVAAVCPVLSLMILECGVWPETAPDALLPKKREERVGQHSDDSSGECKESDVQEPDAEGGGEQRSSARPGCCGRAYNLIMGIWALFRGPFDTAHLVFVASGLWQPACVFLLSSFAFGGIVVWYTLLDWRLNWNPLEMGAFFSAYGVSLALFQAIVVQCMVPRLLSEELAIVSGLFLQTAFFALFAMASSSTLVYLAVPIGALSSVRQECTRFTFASLYPSF